MIIAYASSNNDPLNNLVDSTINLNTGASLPQNVNVYGAGTDSADNSPSFTFSWSLLQKPSSSTASMNDSALQNPVLNGVDVFGNYRLFLIVTNTNSGETSETDPVLAPNSAFTHVRVKSLELALQKPASGERNWNALAYEWVDALENHESRIDDLEVIGLNDLSDVSLNSNQTGQVLKYNGTNWINGNAGGSIDLSDGVNTQTLDTEAGDLVFKSTDTNITFAVATNGSNVEVDTQLSTDVAIDGNLTLNDDNTVADSTIVFKRGDSEIPEIMYDQSASTFKLKRDNAGGLEVIMTQDDIPTSSVRGGVLKVGSTFNSQGKILDIERLVYTQGSDQSVDGKLTGNPSEYPDIRDISATTSGNHCHIMFKNTTGAIIAIANVQLTMLDAGQTTSTDYSFGLNTYTNATAMAENTTTQAVTLPTFSRPSSTSSTGICEWNHITDNSGNFIEIGAGQYFGIKVLSHPDTHKGHCLRCTIEAYRNIEP